MAYELLGLGIVVGALIVMIFQLIITGINHHIRIEIYKILDERQQRINKEDED